jgi:antirestriction protein
MTTTTATAPACLSNGCPDIGVYVACLASYNSGQLYGAWLDLAYVDSIEDLQEGIDWVLVHSPAPDAEEYAIHDNCGLPSCLSGEWPDLHELVSYAKTIRDLCLTDPITYRLACDHVVQVLTAEQFEDINHGLWDRPEDFAQDWYEQTSNLSELGYLASYIDWACVWNGEFRADGFTAEFIPSLGGYLILSNS